MPETSRLKLLNCDKTITETVLRGDSELSELLGIEIAPQWSAFGEPAFKFTLQMIEQNPDDAGWLTYLIILKEKNILIGGCGYKGAPDTDGMVEIGYEIATDYRNQGYATETAGILIQNAFNFSQVKVVRAHTHAFKNESVSVLKKNGMQFCGEFEDPEDGLIFRWEIKK